MFECKLICTDIDGTLLTSKNTISDRTKQALRQARKQGILVALVSGRIKSSLMLLQEEIGIDGPLGCFNGSLVLDDEGRELEAHPLSFTLCNQVLDFLGTTKLEYFVFTNETWYMNQKNGWYAVEVSASRTEGKILPLSQLSDSLAEGERPFKLLAMHEDPAYVKEMETQLQSRFSKQLNILCSSPRYIEILVRGVDKGHAVRSICNFYKLDASTVLAVGDYYNDIGMFRSAGYSVAMGNAPVLVKESASTVTATNDEDGLALVVEAVL